MHLLLRIGGGIARNHSPSNPNKDIHLGDVVRGGPGKIGALVVVQ